VNTDNSAKWRLLIVPIKGDQINDHLFIETYKSNKIKFGMDELRVNDKQ